MSDEPDPFPHKDHRVVQWSFDPIAGFPYTEYWCFDCETSGYVKWGEYILA